jgi:RNA polymerase sigma-70 factor (ECF subfamily)
VNAPALTSPGLSLDEMRLLDALRRGDETAFASLLETYQSALVRVAMIHVGSRAVAEEVVQETWLGVIRGLDRFEGRSSLRTWIFRILANIAKTRAVREGRSVPFSAFAREAAGRGEPSVAPDRFLDERQERWAGHWASPPTRWDTIPEERLHAKETLAVVQAAIETLPPGQRAVITLRDIEGWSSEEICELLDLSEGNQRVLLHRARSKVRAALESYLEHPTPSASS